jgi:hypothetical protein
MRRRPLRGLDVGPLKRRRGSSPTVREGFAIKLATALLDSRATAPLQV